MIICYLLRLIVKAAAGDYPSKRSKKKTELLKNIESLKIPGFFCSILYAIVRTLLFFLMCPANIGRRKAYCIYNFFIFVTLISHVYINIHT